MGILEFIKDAGEATESDSERDGFLSYSGESHAAGLGIAAGFFVVTPGGGELVSLIVAAISAGLRGESARKASPILADVKNEPHYAAGGLVLGVLIGSAIRGMGMV